MEPQFFPGMDDAAPRCLDVNADGLIDCFIATTVNKSYIEVGGIQTASRFSGVGIIRFFLRTRPLGFHGPRIAGVRA